jgi:quinate/shikimate dehydrogenase (NAD+)
LSGIRLGLIGDNIADSRAPDLHRIAGRLCGIELTYDLLVPKHLGLGFDSVFDRVRDEGYRGLNITYPYKETVVRRVKVENHSVRLMEACNTVIFTHPQPLGANTDFTGFMSGFRNTFKTMLPGVVALAGCGGVGKAVSFALARLGANALHLFDTDRSRSERLADMLIANAPSLSVRVAQSIYQACETADGLANCTPAGMVGQGGSAFPTEAIPGRDWAFDAVYTPLLTPFLREARAAGLSAMSGYELFFYQGVDAFRIFTGCDVDRTALRQALEQAKLVWPKN